MTDTASRWATAALRSAFILCNNIYCIPAYVVWLTLIQPIRCVLPELYWKIEGILYHWLLAIVSLWSWSAGYKISESGDDINRCLNDRTLVMANHQSSADVLLLMSCFNSRPGVLSRIMWIMGHRFLRTHFGIVSLLHGDFFIQAGKYIRGSSLDILTQHLKQYYTPMDRNFIVLFPEGGFLCNKRETSQKFAAKNNLPILNHVSLPRAGAMEVIINNVGPLPDSRGNNGSEKELKWILDVTIGYENAEPLTLVDIATGLRKPFDIRFHYRIFPSEIVPKDTKDMTNWLYKLYEEKEKLLEYFYENGHFPAECPDGVTRNNRDVLIEQSYWRYSLISLFYLISAYLQTRMFLNLVRYVTDSLGF